MANGGTVNRLEDLEGLGRPGAQDHVAFSRSCGVMNWNFQFGLQFAYNSHGEVPMKKTTMLYVTLAVLFVGALFYQFVLHPNPYTGESPAKDAGLVKQSP